MVFVFPQANSQSDNTLLREDFNNLDNWRPLYFPKISHHSTYAVERHGGESFLKAESAASASAIVYKQEFNVYEYSTIQWRWKISNVCLNADFETKSGDDCPIRIYVIFKYDTESAHGLDKVKYGFAKKLYGGSIHPMAL
jgi:hypothetical protein